MRASAGWADRAANWGGTGLGCHDGAMGDLYLWPDLPDDPDALALDDLERTRTRGQLTDRVVRIAHLLRDHYGLQAGDHASMLMGNRVEFYELLLGSILAGVNITPINWHLTASEVSYIVEDSTSKVLFADPDFADTAKDATTRPVLVAGPEMDDALASSTATMLDLDGPAGGAMLYTSGTTGRPKGVARVSRESVAVTLQRSRGAGAVMGLDAAWPHLVTGPLYHSAPLGFSSPALPMGSPLILMAKWDPESMLDLIETRKVRHMHMVPIMFVRSLRLPEERRAAFDPSSIGVVIHGAAPVSPQVKAQMIEWWGPVFREYWGSTEGGVFTLVDSEDWLKKPGTVGKAIPIYDVFAVDDDGQQLPAGEIGTLYTRNKLTAQTFVYHGDEEKTKKAHLEPGVFTMGDVGWVDDEGYVFLCDRAADMIISGGVNIYPAEIEQVLIEHPAVRDVAVFGIPDEEWGESVKAAVELMAGYEASDALAREILAFGRERLAGFKVPRSIDFEAELPRHPTGKLYKRLLRDRYWNREAKFI